MALRRRTRRLNPISGDSESEEEENSSETSMEVEDEDEQPPRPPPHLLSATGAAESEFESFETSNLDMVNDLIQRNLIYSEKALEEAKKQMLNNNENAKDYITQIKQKTEKRLLHLIKEKMIIMKSSEISEKAYRDVFPSDAVEEPPEVNNIASINKYFKGILNKTVNFEETAKKNMDEFKKSLTDVKLRKTEAFKAWENRFNNFCQINSSQDDIEFDDDDEIDPYLPTVDPISKTPLKDPVRNVICGHIYGLTSIMHMLDRNAKLRCPTMGCSNKHPLKKKDIVADPDLSSRIRKNIELINRKKAKI